MQNVSLEEVEKLAALSRIDLTKEEVSGAADTLSAILEHFESIQSISTEDVPSADDVTVLKNIARDDIARDGFLAQPDILLHNAHTKNGYVEVSGVFADNGVS